MVEVVCLLLFGTAQVIDVFDGKIVFRKPIDEKEKNGNGKKKAKAEA